VPRSSYYHRQADLCMRMALSASTRDERIRLVELANEYRHKASQAELLPCRRDTPAGHRWHEAKLRAQGHMLVD
jgi:hypothetical protein